MQQNNYKLSIYIILTCLAALICLTVVSTFINININKSIIQLSSEIKTVKTKTIVKEVPLVKYKNKELTIDNISDLIEQLQPRLDKTTRYKIAKAIIDECKKKELDPILIIAIIYYESTFRPLAESKSGAVGLMQVRYKTWREHPILKDNGVTAKDKLFWIDNNIKCGTDILKKYLDESNGNIAVALNRYHTGATKLNKEVYEIPYVNKIMLMYYNLRSKAEGLVK